MHPFFCQINGNKQTCDLSLISRIVERAFSFYQVAGNKQTCDLSLISPITPGNGWGFSFDLELPAEADFPAYVTATVTDVTGEINLANNSVSIQRNSVALI